jgi:diguanylate cyclase (GGDEF)-like protein
MLQPIARVLLLTQFVALVLVASGSALLVMTASRYQSASRWVQHTYEALDEIATVRSEALRGSLALRNYAISPDAAYLIRTRAAARNAADASQRLEMLVQDGAAQARRAFALRAEVAELAGWMASSAVIAERDGQTALLESLRPRVEQDSAKVLRELLEEIETQERLLLQTRSNERAAEYLRLVIGAGMVAGAFAVFLIWSVVYASSLLRRGKASIQGLKESADLDPLTGLLNRRALDEQFERHKQSPLTVVALDFDDFKAVNDAYGHEAGDEVLRVSADRLRRECRDNDLIARVGGDEFVLVLTGVSDVDAARRVCGRMRQSIRAPIQLQAARVQIGASIGFEVSPGGGSLKDLLARADAAAYHEKSHRKATPLSLVRN